MESVTPAPVPAKAGNTGVQGRFAMFQFCRIENLPLQSIPTGDNFIQSVYRSCKKLLCDILITVQ